MAQYSNGKSSPYKSEGERRLAGLLTRYGIPFVYEPRIRVSDGARRRTLVPDFYTPFGKTYIEYFGRIGTSDYDRRVAEKLRLYEENELRLTPLYPWDLARAPPESLPSGLEHLIAHNQQASPMVYHRWVYRPRHMYGASRYRGPVRRQGYRAE